MRAGTNSQHLLLDTTVRSLSDLLDSRVKLIGSQSLSRRGTNPYFEFLNVLLKLCHTYCASSIGTDGCSRQSLALGYEYGSL